MNFANFSGGATQNKHKGVEAMTDTLSCDRMSFNLYLLVISTESNKPFQGKLL